MPQLGLVNSLTSGNPLKGFLRYALDGLKLYMPTRGSRSEEIQFVGTDSMSFDGTNDYVGIADDSSLNITNNQTIICWAKNDNSGLGDGEYMTARYKSSGEDSRVYAFHLDAAEKLNFASSDDGESGTMVWKSDSAISNINTWTHYATTFESGTVKMYVNGVSIAITRSGETHSAMASENVDMAIGSISEAGGGYWEGSIKNVAIWNRVLTATEIQNVMYKSYEEVSGRLLSGMVSWWALEESIVALVTKVADSHGSNTGTITGATISASGSGSKYGGVVPTLPRMVDNSPKVQADAIGAGSALFDGVDDYIDVGDFESTLQNPFTVTMWVKPDDGQPSSDEYLIGTKQSTDNFWVRIETDGDIQFYYKEGTTESNRTASVYFSDG